MSNTTICKHKMYITYQWSPGSWGGWMIKARVRSFSFTAIVKGRSIWCHAAKMFHTMWMSMLPFYAMGETD